MTDAELGERLAALEPRLRLLLVHLSGRAVRERIEVDDLVQEVFLRALSRAAALPPPAPNEAPLFGLLTRIARNTVIDAVRAIRAAKRDGREARLDASEWSRAGVTSPTAGGPGPATAAIGRETSRELARAFLDLPPEYRRVLGLRQLEGLSAAETGRRMGRSEVAVHSLYRRALSAWGEAAG